MIIIINKSFFCVLCRSLGISWALKYVQKETVCQDEEKTAQASEILPVTSVTLDPNAGVTRSLEAAPETPEAEDKTHPTSNLNTDDDNDGVDAAASLLSPSQQLIRKSIDEMMDISDYLDMVDETDRIYWKKRDKRLEDRAMHEALKEPPTVFQKVLTACRDALESTPQDVLLPYTLLHCLNLAFPGAAGIVVHVCMCMYACVCMCVCPLSISTYT